MDIRHERMSNEFEKFHLGDGRVLHHFTDVDRGGPHDHPWSFTSHVLSGGYVERVYTHNSEGWTSEEIHRRPGDTFSIAAEHIHEIVHLPEGQCWTIVSAGPNERETRFWQFGEQVKSRPWHQDHFD
jgi:hypothetical protein